MKTSIFIPDDEVTMKDMPTTKAQLVAELERLRERVAQLEGSVAGGALDTEGQLFRAMVEQANDIIYTLADDGTFRYVSPNWTAVLGHETSEIVGYPFMPLVHEDDLPACLEFMGKVLSSGGRHGGIEYRVRHKDGAWRWHMSNASVMTTPDGGRIFTGIARDITEKKQAEEALARHQEELEARVEERTRELTELNRKLHEEIADRELAEEALAASEAKYRALFENSVVGQFRIAVGGKMLDANRAMAEMFGWDDVKQFVDECDMSERWVEASDRALMYKYLRERGELDHFETRFYRKDGTIVSVRISSRMYPEGGYQEGIGIDVSEEKAALDALKESEKKFRSLAESTTAQITIIQDDCYVYANQAFLDYHGLAPADLALITPADLAMGVMSTEAIQQAREAWTTAMERGDTCFSVEFPDVDGRWFQTNVTVIELDGKLSFVGMTFDITELKLAQREIEESEKRYRTIFETAATAMISCGNDAVITLANDEWVNLTGYSKEETEGKMTWMPLFTGETLERMKRYHAMRSVDPDSAPRFYEAQLVDRHGKTHDGYITVNLVPGTLQRVASFQDMTELKRAQREMYRADKMAALGQIIAGVAHEINNPNNFIYFNLPILRRYIEAIAPLLEERVARDPDLKILNMSYRVFFEDVFKLLENMEHGSKRISSIVADLKNYVRSDDEQERKAEHVAQPIDRVMTLVGKQVRKMVKRFDVEIAEGLPRVEMNPGKIEQVLINLVINAGQAADKEDSWVRLSARSAADPAGWVEILVEDNGAGIPEEHLDQIFEPFFTSKGREQGTGLGLSISHRIVEEHGGVITVASEIGAGTRFTISLPAVGEECG